MEMTRRVRSEIDEVGRVQKMVRRRSEMDGSIE